MKKKRFSLPLLFSVAAGIALSCGAPSLPTGPRRGGYPSEASDEGGKYQCKVVTGADNPWLVEWDPTDKVRIESESQGGVLLVKYAECELEVLYGCEVKGRYEFRPTTRKQQTEYINNADELFAKLPIGALNLVSEFEQGDRWALDYVLMGTRRSTVRRVHRGQLAGRCAEATHFVSGMAVGAYQLGSRAHRRGHAEASFKSVGAGIESGGEAGLLRRDGMFERCARSETGSDDPDCKAIVQLYLQPLSEGAGPASNSSTPSTSSTSSTPSTLDSLLEDSPTEGPAAPAPTAGTKEYKAKLEKQWAAVKKAARKRDTEGKLDLYQAFLSEFPVDNPYAGKARTQIDKWEKALSKELEQRSAAEAKAARLAAAKARQEEIRRAKERAENATGSASTKLAAWEGFVDSYPDKDNPYLATAKRKIKSLKAQIAREDRAAAAKKASKWFTSGCGDSPTGKGAKMCAVPSGGFRMGCNDDVDKECDGDEKPYHRVTLEAYYMDRHEVTVDEYERCVSAGRCETDGLTMPYWSDKDQPDWAWACNWGKSGKGDHPINCVPWQYAVDYCAWAGKRLPTEAEWEKAARGTDGRKYAWGNSGYGATAVANISDETAHREQSKWKYASGYDDGYYGTSPVGSFPRGKSPYGLLDMIGNVFEWVSDRYGKGYYGESSLIDPKGPNSGKFRVLRGGSWCSRPSFARASNRFGPGPVRRDEDNGFRCALSSPSDF